MTNTTRDRFIHDVNAKCGSLKDAAALLREASPKDFAELLSLMFGQADDLKRIIASHTKKVNP